jgi:hypothetical protein
MILIRHKAFWLFQFSDFTSSTNENEVFVGHQGDIGYRRFMFNEHFDIFSTLFSGSFPFLRK